MKKMICKTLAVLLTLPQINWAQTTTATAAATPVATSTAPILLEGYIPGDLGPTDSSPSARVKKIFFLIDKGVIQKYFSKMPPADQIPANAIILNEKRTGKLLLSPGFIDMHNHLDHAVVPLWTGAEGKFNNRFSWRDNADYEQNVRGQIKKIKEKDTAAKLTGVSSNACKIIQYAEMKALLGGVTTIQGIGGTANNACGFGHLIRNVENREDFRVTTDARVSFEVINPTHGLMLQNHMLPIMQSTGATLEEAYLQVPQEIREGQTFAKWFKPTELTNLVELFTAAKLKSLRDTFQNMVAVNPAGKNRAFITHLAEGKSADPFSKTEFKMAQAIGFAKPGMVMIHGIGLNEQDWIEAKKSEINLVWSPFSNLLLYGETTDVVAAKKAGINISLGSDWAPSGTKTLLDEVRIAKRYLHANQLDTLFTDKEFYEMLTINAAKALGLEKLLGKLEPGYLADIVAVPLTSTKVNPYSTIVNSDSSTIKLVIAGGKLVIANKALVQSTDVTEPIVTEAVGSCAKLKNQVVVNLGFSLHETIATLTPMVKVMDGHITCADKLYQSNIDRLFKIVYKPENRGQIDLGANEEKFEALNIGLNELLLRKSVLK